MQMLDQIVMFRVISVARLFQACLAIAGRLLLIPGAARADYIVTDVSSPGDPAFTQLLGINNSSTIAGYFGDGTAVANNGFTLVLPNSYTPENVPAAAQTKVIGINNTGWNDGFYTDT